MSKTCEYISKKDLKKYKDNINNVIFKIKKDFKEKFGFSFSFWMVGSARRNLVLVRGGENWDIDYQIIFNNNKIDSIKELHKIKIYLIDSFKKYFENSVTVNNSKSVITIILNENENGKFKVSYDIAIIKNTISDSERYILSGKSSNPQDSNYIKWNTLRHDKNLLKRVKEVNGTILWEKLRNIYKRKKCCEYLLSEDERKDSESLFAESIKETLD